MRPTADAVLMINMSAVEDAHLFVDERVQANAACARVLRVVGSVWLLALLLAVVEEHCGDAAHDGDSHADRHLDEHRIHVGLLTPI